MYDDLFILFVFFPVTPPDYQPPGFREAEGDVMEFEQEPVKLAMGEVATPFHSVKFDMITEKHRLEQVICYNLNILYIQYIYFKKSKHYWKNTPVYAPIVFKSYVSFVKHYSQSQHGFCSRCFTALLYRVQVKQSVSAKEKWEMTIEEPDVITQVCKNSRLFKCAE